MIELQPGDAAPDFTLPRSGGGTLSLHDLRGRKVILYFYPKDDTSGCTKEACEFRDTSEQIEEADAVVLGISPDGVASHDRFRQKYALPFALLADEDHAVAERYGVWQEKSLYGKKYWGIARTTFLIDEEGRIERVWERVKPAGHAADVLAAVTSAR
jgi:peroxiredoxin Q/BCP